MNTKQILLGGCLALACSVAAYAQTPAPAAKPGQPMTQAPRPDKAEMDRIEADYKAATEKCKAMKGNAKDICKAEAGGQRKIAKAEAWLKADNTPDRQRDLDKAKADAEYDIAKEKCEDQKGDAQKTCKKEAKSKKEMALASAKKK